MIKRWNSQSVLTPCCCCFIGDYESKGVVRKKLKFRLVLYV